MDDNEVNDMVIDFVEFIVIGVLDDGGMRGKMDRIGHWRTILSRYKDDEEV